MELKKKSPTAFFENDQLRDIHLFFFLEQQIDEKLLLITLNFC